MSRPSRDGFSHKSDDDAPKQYEIDAADTREALAQLEALAQRAIDADSSNRVLLTAVVGAAVAIDQKKNATPTSQLASLRAATIVLEVTLAEVVPRGGADGLQPLAPAVRHELRGLLRTARLPEELVARATESGEPMACLEAMLGRRASDEIVSSIAAACVLADMQEPAVRARAVADARGPQFVKHLIAMAARTRRRAARPPTRPPRAARPRSERRAARRAAAGRPRRPAARRRA